MAGFNVSKEAFENAFGKSKNSGKLTEEFMNQLKDYLEGKKFKSAILIREWIKHGGVLSSFTCREDMFEPLVTEMRKNRIPFIVVNEMSGGVGFLIRSEDSIRTQKVSRLVLKAHSQYCSVTTGEEAGTVYRKSSEPDKAMLQICGLGQEEILYLEEECNTTFPGGTVGVDKMGDGTYMFSCHGKASFAKKKHGKNFGRSFSETIMVMNGSTAEKMRKRMQDTAAFRIAKANGFPGENGEMDKTVWVVGDGNHFVESSEKGFKLGHAMEIGDTVVLDTDLLVNKDDPNYNVRLNSALAHIVGRKCLYTYSDVVMYFKTKKKYSKDQTITGIQVLVEQADEMIQKKIQKDNITHLDGKWEHKFKHYQHEMGRLMRGVRDGKLPKGYEKEEMLQLINIKKAFGLDMKSLTPAIEKMMQLEVYSHDATQNKVNNIEQQIAKFRDHGGIAHVTDHDRSVLEH